MAMVVLKPGQSRALAGLALAAGLAAGCSLTLGFDEVQGGSCDAAALASDHDSCGQCGHACSASAQCVEGVCLRAVATGPSPPRRLAVRAAGSANLLSFTLPAPPSDTDGTLGRAVDDGSAGVTVTPLPELSTVRHVMSSPRGDFVLQVGKEGNPPGEVTSVLRIEADGSGTCVQKSDTPARRLAQDDDRVYLPSRTRISSFAKNTSSSTCQATETTHFALEPKVEGLDIIDIAVGNAMLVWSAGQDHYDPRGLFACPKSKLPCDDKGDELRAPPAPAGKVDSTALFFTGTTFYASRRLAPTGSSPVTSEFFRLEDRPDATWEPIGQALVSVDRLAVWGESLVVTVTNGTTGELQKGSVPGPGATVSLATFVRARRPFALEPAPLGGRLLLYWTEREATPGRPAGVYAIEP